MPPVGNAVIHGIEDAFDSKKELKTMGKKTIVVVVISSVIAGVAGALSIWGAIKAARAAKGA